MLSLLAALLLSQSAPQPDEAASIRSLIDAQLISVKGASGWGGTFSRGERTAGQLRLVRRAESL